MGRRPKNTNQAANQVSTGVKNFNQENVRSNSDGKILNKLVEKVDMMTRSVEVLQKPVRDGSHEEVLRNSPAKERVQQWIEIVTGGTSRNSWAERVEQKMDSRSNDRGVHPPFAVLNGFI